MNVPHLHLLVYVCFPNTQQERRHTMLYTIEASNTEKKRRRVSTLSAVSFSSLLCTLNPCQILTILIKAWLAPDSSFWAFSSHPLQKSKNQKIRKSKNGDSEMISVPVHLRHKAQKWKCPPKTLVLKDMRWSAFFVTRHSPVQITEMLRPMNFRISETFRDGSVSDKN